MVAELLPRFSVCIPNCPAAAATAAISSALEGSSLDISFIPCSSSAICSVVPSTVFLTPANALSQSTCAFIAAVPIATTGSVTVLVNALPILVDFSPKLEIFSPAF